MATTAAVTAARVMAAAATVASSAAVAVASAAMAAMAAMADELHHRRCSVAFFVEHVESRQANV
jgi:hypothetical protein